MAGGAHRIATNEPRLPRWSRLERIKDETLGRIQRCQLDVATLGNADKHVIVEVDGARCRRTNEVGVKAGLREHQHLRIDIDVEMLEQTWQESQIFLVVERHLMPLDLVQEH